MTPSHLAFLRAFAEALLPAAHEPPRRFLDVSERAVAKALLAACAAVEQQPEPQPQTVAAGGCLCGGEVNSPEWVHTPHGCHHRSVAEPQPAAAPSGQAEPLPLRQEPEWDAVMVLKRAAGGPYIDTSAGMTPWGAEGIRLLAGRESVRLGVRVLP